MHVTRGKSALSSNNNAGSQKKRNEKKEETAIEQPSAKQAADSSAKDYMQRIGELQIETLNQIKEKERLQSEIQNRHERFIKRETEYRKIIDELQYEIKHKAVIKSTDKEASLSTCHNLHGEIMDNINNIQLKTSKILVDQEKDIIRFFNNKINEIKKQFEEERIKKGKKDQDYIEKENQLISELEWIKNIAQKIDQENHNLMKKYMDLKAQYQTQENDREMLLKELIMKKKKNAILRSQIEQYEKLLNDVSKDADDTDDVPEKEDISRAQKSVYNNNNMQNSRMVQSNPQNSKSMIQSQLSKSQIREAEKFHITSIQRYDNTIRALKSTVRKEQKRVHDLKQMYVREIETKTELEKIIRVSLQEIKQDLDIDGAQRLSHLKYQNEQLSREVRRRLIDRLLNNDKILTLVYDKTFYPDMRQGDFNIDEDPARQQIIAVNEQEKNFQQDREADYTELDLQAYDREIQELQKH